MPFHHACIVAAHPDDEILWFSSVAGRVERIVLCYVSNPNRPRLGRGRLAALQDIPLPSPVVLGLDEADVFDLARWPDPDVTRTGLALGKARTPAPVRRYEANFDLLVDELGRRLQGCARVFTHNPWGEYGNEEHVQVYRAVRTLQPSLGFELWCTGYVSSRSTGLMTRSLDGVVVETMTLPTDRVLAQEVAARYQAAGAWTWSDGYVWPESESFLRLTPGARPAGTVPTAPLIYLDLGLPPLGLADRSLRAIARKLRQKLGLG